MTVKIYPLWFNIGAFSSLMLPPVGLLLAVLANLDVIGAIIMCVGFLGIWIFNEVAKLLKPKKKED